MVSSGQGFFNGTCDCDSNYLSDLSTVGDLLVRKIAIWRIKTGKSSRVPVGESCTLASCKHVNNHQAIVAAAPPPSYCGLWALICLYNSLEELKQSTEAKSPYD